MTNSIANFILSNKQNLIDLVFKHQFFINPSIKTKYNSNQIESFKNDISYNLEFLSVSIYFDSLKLFEHYTHWLDIVLSRFHLDRNELAEHFNSIAIVVKNLVEKDDFSIINEYVQIAIDHFTTKGLFIPESDLEKNCSIGSLFLETLLKLDLYNALEIIKTELTLGSDIEMIIKSIFLPVLHEIGFRWQTGKINVAQEHYISNAIMEIAYQINPFNFQTRPEESDKFVVLVCPVFENHSIGIKLLKKVYEFHGWRTYLIGELTPKKDLIELIVMLKPKFLVISTSLITNLIETEKTISLIKSLPLNIKILVGGYAFDIDETIWTKAGADYYAKNFDEAIQISNRFINTND